MIDPDELDAIAEAVLAEEDGSLSLPVAPGLVLELRACGRHAGGRLASTYSHSGTPHEPLAGNAAAVRHPPAGGIPAGGTGGRLLLTRDGISAGLAEGGGYEGSCSGRESQSGTSERAV